MSTNDGYSTRSLTAVRDNHNGTATVIWHNFGVDAITACVGPNGTVYAAGQSLYALNPNTGAIKWTLGVGDDAGEIFTAPVVGSDSTVYYLNGFGVLYAVNGLTGKELWEEYFGVGGADYEESSPAIGADGTLYFGGLDGQLHAIGANTIANLTTSPSITVTGGSDLVGTVYLAGPAGPGNSVAGQGNLVTLSSSSADVQVPNSVTVDTGEMTANFTITTSTVTSARQAEILAKLGTSAKAITIVLKPAAPANLTFSPSTVIGTGTTIGTVYLNGKTAAPLIISLLADSDRVTVPSSITIPAGGVSGAFKVATKQVSQTSKVAIKAFGQSATLVRNIVVSPGG